MGRCLVRRWTWTYPSARDQRPGLGAVRRPGHRHSRQHRWLRAPRPWEGTRRLWALRRRLEAPGRRLRMRDQGLLTAEPARGARSCCGPAALDGAHGPDHQHGSRRREAGDQRDLQDQPGDVQDAADHPVQEYVDDGADHGDRAYSWAVTKPRLLLLTAHSATRT